jgi:hypothetical protein
MTTANHASLCANEDCKLINEAVLRAAARARLVEKKKQLKFDPQEFAEIALEKANVAGFA